MLNAVKEMTLVTGAQGQLAGAMVAGLGGEVIGLSHAELDIGDAAAVSACVAQRRPNVIVNCASYNHVDRAEDDAETALRVNGLALRNLARAAEATGATLVHFSTDFVFDGNAAEPYTEDDTPNPQSVYAASKLVGEWFAREVPRAFVLRVESLFGGPAARSSVDRIIAAVREGREARVFQDRVVSPSYVEDVVTATRALIESGTPGLYHCVNSGHATWHEVGQEVVRLLGQEGTARLVPISVSEVSLPAPRPQFAALSNAKLAAAGIAMPTWQDALARYIRPSQASA